MPELPGSRAYEYRHSPMLCKGNSMLRHGKRTMSEPWRASLSNPDHAAGAHPCPMTGIKGKARTVRASASVSRSNFFAGNIARGASTLGEGANGRAGEDGVGHRRGVALLHRLGDAVPDRPG